MAGETVGKRQLRRDITESLTKRLLLPRYGAAEAVELVTADGIRLAGARMTGPPEARMAIVLVHGFSHSSRTPRIHSFARQLARRTHVVVPDLRGHGASGGLCSLGATEVLDVAAAVTAAPEGLPVATVGISLGGAAVLLHAGMHGTERSGFAGVVAISAPAWWGAWDTPSTNRIRRYASSPLGRAFLARAMGTRLAADCQGVPDSAEVVAAIAPAFTVVIHDPADHYFGPEHAQTLFRWANEPRDLWWLPGTGHGTDLLSAALADRIVSRVESHLFPPPPAQAMSGGRLAQSAPTRAR